MSIYLFMSQQWQGETQEFCPNAKVVLVGCKLDMRTDVNTLRELSKQRLIPVTHEQVRTSQWWICEKMNNERRCPGKKHRLENNNDSEKKLESNPAVIYSFFHLGSEMVLPLWCPTGRECERRFTQHNQPPPNKSCVKPLRDMLLGLAFWPKFADKRCKVWWGRWKRHRQLVEFMSRDTFFSLKWNIHADLGIFKMQDE